MIKQLLPPPQWQLPVVIALGVFVGLFSFVFKVSNAPSYLSDNPGTCVNCHIMAPQYATWQHSSHREWAHCNDCHVPHNNVLNKYYFKGKDGLRHATIFTMRKEPQVIFIKKEGADVVHQNCIRCHEQQITDAKLATTVKNHTAHTQDRKCWDCHREVPHGRVNSLSSTPHAQVPLPTSPVPAWLKQLMK
ncbi:cytochrome c nitrite reductase small subunit [Plebeiibacterium marinum]|uniref:Cytochrome c nitrite reductase small subunit n=1 Tax=Plebeiibacterium marinum TaxID=2992111 RepID=A0AAE3SI92_9BACT|nr:cytochrome c nitrite reductase small subunit [Plebeiobacterium marinum]MCW3804218.1 cytochrome c nitrite reductase small subunit [Plebeiobacterium marinum]